MDIAAKSVVMVEGTGGTSMSVSVRQIGVGVGRDAGPMQLVDDSTLFGAVGRWGDAPGDSHP
jgi:hypothetical protein